MIRDKVNLMRRYWLLYFFIAVFAVISIIFGIYPMISSFCYSFFKGSSVMSNPVFVGLDNYTKLIHDEYFWKSFRLTILFTVISVPMNIIVSMILAQLLDKVKRGQLFFKLAIFIPYITPDVVGSVVWKHVFNSQGAANSLLTALGFEPVGWLTTPETAFAVLAFVELWKHVGLYTIIIMTNYQLIDRTMYEAAMIDGASSWQEYFYITIPALKPAISLNTAYAIIQFLKTYTVSRIITFGGPNYSTNFLSYYAYSKYERMDFGSATAVATMLFILIVVITLLGGKLKRRGL